MDGFPQWLRTELEKRNWKQADLARAAHLDTAVVSNLYNGKRGPGEDTSRAIAEAFDLPVEIVFRAAGILPQRNGDTDPQLEEANHLLSEMSPEARSLALALLRTLYERHEPKPQTKRKREPRVAGSDGG